jgi:hypothetical protein
MDKGTYWKPDTSSVIQVMTPEEEREWKIMDNLKDKQNKKSI